MSRFSTQMFRFPDSKTHVAIFQALQDCFTRGKRKDSVACILEGDCNKCRALFSAWEQGSPLSRFQRKCSASLTTRLMLSFFKPFKIALPDFFCLSFTFPRFLSHSNNLRHCQSANRRSVSSPTVFVLRSLRFKVSPMSRFSTQMFRFPDSKTHVVVFHALKIALPQRNLIPQKSDVTLFRPFLIFLNNSKNKEITQQTNKGTSHKSRHTFHPAIPEKTLFLRNKRPNMLMRQAPGNTNSFQLLLFIQFSFFTFPFPQFSSTVTISDIVSRRSVSSPTVFVLRSLRFKGSPMSRFSTQMFRFPDSKTHVVIFKPCKIALPQR
ncbi:hypothetical protein CEXT_414951 [Caerostris extrusa]|uniref:Transmembrane protein n=1 Tax=Caerostris extrusa TaxID=172846 RepID=A0AAV4MN99_CAEEX|nr:hypothetical protein CEXT_414951 [Caerostris extrusa]